MRNVTDIEPFVLYYDRDKPWLDVPHLLLRWLNVARTEQGPLFLRFDAHDRPLVGGKPMVCSIKMRIQIEFSKNEDLH